MEISLELAKEILECEEACMSESLGGNIYPLLDQIFLAYPELKNSYAYSNGWYQEHLSKLDK